MSATNNSSNKRRRVAKKVVEEESPETPPEQTVIIVDVQDIPDLLSTFTPTVEYPVNVSVQSFFKELHRSTCDIRPEEITKQSKTTRSVNKRKKKSVDDTPEDVPNEIEFKDANGETINISKITESLNNPSGTEGAAEDQPLELKFVEIRSSKNNSKTKNTSKHEKIQNNTEKHMLKPTLVQSKTLTSATEAKVIEVFNKDAFIEKHFIQSACACNDTVKNGKFYAYDKYGCIIRADCYNKNTNPYCWRFDENNEPVSIFASENCTSRDACIQAMKNKYSTAFGSKGMAYRLYKKCYSDINI